MPHSAAIVCRELGCVADSAALEAQRHRPVAPGCPPQARGHAASPIPRTQTRANPFRDHASRFWAPSRSNPLTASRGARGRTPRPIDAIPPRRMLRQLPHHPMRRLRSWLRPLGALRDPSRARSWSTRSACSTQESIKSASSRRREQGTTASASVDPASRTGEASLASTAPSEMRASNTRPAKSDAIPARSPAFGPLHRRGTCTACNGSRSQADRSLPTTSRTRRARSSHVVTTCRSFLHVWLAADDSKITSARRFAAMASCHAPSHGDAARRQRERASCSTRVGGRSSIEEPRLCVAP